MDKYDRCVRLLVGFLHSALEDGRVIVKAQSISEPDDWDGQDALSLMDAALVKARIFLDSTRNEAFADGDERDKKIAHLTRIESELRKGLDLAEAKIREMERKLETPTKPDQERAK